MAGALSVVGSSVVESTACPCLFLDALPSSTVNLRNSGDSVAVPKSSIRKRVFRRPGKLELSSSFVDLRSISEKMRAGSTSQGSRKHRKGQRRLVIVNDLGGQYEDTFGDVKTQILNYFTYKAVRTVLNQLYEMNPPQYRWFYDFVVRNKPGDGKRFIRTLGKEKHELAERVMVTRLHLYGKWVKICDHAAMYQEISDQNLELMRERLLETVAWPPDDTNTEKIG